MPGAIRDALIFQLELGRCGLRDVTRERGAETVGRLREACLEPGEQVQEPIG